MTKDRFFYRGKPIEAWIGLALMIATVVFVLVVSIGQAHAAACGGNTTPHVVPPNGLDCTNSVTVSGITGTAHLTVSVTGAVHVDATVNPKVPGLYLQVKAHEGISSNNGFQGATAVFVNGKASVDVQMPACTSQIDTKIVPGTPTLDHVDAKYRIAAPLVELPNCGTDTTTSTSPSTVVTTTTVTVTTTVPGTSPTTGPSVGSSVPGTSPATLPTTGSPINPVYAGLGVALLVGLGVLLVALGRRQLPPPVS